jgi:DNA-binding transcriptional regulator YiaG
MKTVATLEDTVPRLQLERALVPIDEFAVREGVSRSAVEDWANMGLVQLRKRKGKTFVVDVPPGPCGDSYNTLSDQQPRYRNAPKPTGIRQLAIIVLAICAFAAILASLWMYSDRQGLLESITLAYERIDRADENLTHAKQQAQNLQSQLNEANVELDQLKGQLVRSKAEIKDVRSQLGNTRQNLATLRQYNVEAERQLNEQIEKLTKLTNEVSVGR